MNMKKASLFVLVGLAAAIVSFYALNALHAKAVTEPNPDPCTAENGTGCGGDFTPTVAPNPLPLGGTLTVSGTATGAVFSAANGGNGGCGNYVTTAPTLDSPISWTMTSPNITGTIGGQFALTQTSAGSSGGGTTCSSPPGPGNPSPGGSWGTPYNYSFNFSINAQNYGLKAGDYTLTFSTTDSMGHVIQSAPISFTIAPSGAPNTAGQSIGIQSITPSPATNQITVSGDAAGGIYTGGLICQTGGSTGPWVSSEQAVQLAATGTYSIDGNALGSFSFVQTQQGIGKECPPSENPAMYEYSFAFSDATDIASLSNGAHTLQVCASAGLCDSKSFTVQNAAPAILQLSTHSINLSGSGLNGQNIQVTNAGPATSQMSWSATPSVSWLSAGPANNPVPVNGGTSQTVNIMASANGLTPGVHIGSITFAATSIVDGTTLAPQSITVSYNVSGSPTVSTGTLTVLSENAVTNGPVNATWDIYGGSSSAYPNGTDLCADGATCSGSEQTYSGEPATDNNGNPGVPYTFMPIAPSNANLFALKSAGFAPIAEKKVGVIDAMLSLTRGIFGSTAEAFVIPTSNPANASLFPQNTLPFIVEWDPIAGISVSSTPISLTATTGSSTTGQIQIVNTGAPGSKLTWTAASDSSWLTATPSADASGLTNDNSGDESSENVTINAASQPVGSYTGHIIFTGTSYYPAPGLLKGSLTVQYNVAPANPGNAVTGVTIVSCSPSTIDTTQTSNCTASVTGTGGYSNAVTWSVDTGSISSTGADTAQFTPASAGTAHITACSSEAGYTNVCDTYPVTITTPPLGACTPGVTCPICSDPIISASPSNIVVPESSELSYNCQNVNSCTLTGSDGSNYPITWVGPTTASGTQSVAPPATTVYTFKCTNTGYSPSSASVSLPVQVTVGGTSRCEQNPNGAGCSGQ